MEKTEMTCDCGCGAKIALKPNQTDWLILYQPTCVPESYEPKLQRVFHFATLVCLAKWSKKAEEVGKSLTKSAQEMGSVRGTYSDETFKGVCV